MYFQFIGIIKYKWLDDVKAVWSLAPSSDRHVLALLCCSSVNLEPKSKRFIYQVPELGKRQYCRDNETMY